MRIKDLNWMQVEEYLKRDDRAVLPLGSTEQHAYLSLATDRSARRARRGRGRGAARRSRCSRCVSYGITPNFRAYPGTVSLRVETFLAVVRDCLDALAAQGFRRVLIVNGHGGNLPAMAFVNEWVADHPGMKVKFHNWWNAPKTIAKVHEIDPVASHASWMENFPWTRVEGVTPPTTQKPMIDWPAVSMAGPANVRTHLGDGNFGGCYQRSDDEMMAIWAVAVEETRALLAGGW